ncbi:MAG: hypothetical protein ACI4IQ_03280 [Eubacterium sp.]
MIKNNFSKGKIYCLISAAVIFGCYIAERIITITATPSRTLAIGMAFAFSLAVAVVYFLVVKSNEIFYGILTAVFGFRMLPPALPMLEKFSPAANIVYFVVEKAALVIFALAIINLYQRQKKPRLIKPIPILCLLITVPYLMEIAGVIGAFFTSRFNGNKLYEYFTAFLFYAIAMIITLYIASRSNKVSACLMLDYQLVALIINAGRRICAIIITTLNGNHISRSYYCWLLIYAFFFIAFLALRKKKKSSTI